MKNPDKIEKNVCEWLELPYYDIKFVWILSINRRDVISKLVRYQRQPVTDEFSQVLRSLFLSYKYTPTNFVPVNIILYRFPKSGYKRAELAGELKWSVENQG